DDEQISALLEGDKIAKGTYYAIQRKLKRLLQFGFLRERVTEHFVERILDYLVRGENVVVEFGRYGNDLSAYIFIANYITRRIHEKYVQMKEAAEGGGPEPRKLVIAVEEAHKFLD